MTNRESITAPCFLMLPKEKYTYKPSSCSNRTPWKVLLYSTARSYRQDNAGGRLRGCCPWLSADANLLALSLGIRHARAHTGSYHGKFQLTEYTCHL